MNIQLDRTSPKSLSSQIADQIREMIHSRVLSDGGRIPSTRLLSKELSINRITVSHAYNRLISEGLLRTGVGSGTYVQVNILGNKGESKNKLDRSNLGPIFSKAAASIQQAYLAAPILDDASPGMINFATLIPDERFFPVDAFKDCLVEVMDREGSKVLQYCGTLGYPPLREYLAERMRESGIEVDWDGILVVNGAQQGIDRTAHHIPSVHFTSAFHLERCPCIVVHLLTPAMTLCTITDQMPDIQSQGKNSRRGRCT